MVAARWLDLRGDEAPTTPRSHRGAGRIFETLGAALQLPSTPRFQRTADAVDTIGASPGVEPSTPHCPRLEETPEHDVHDSAKTNSPSDRAVVRRAQASMESTTVARMLDSIAAGADEVDLWGAGLSDLQVSVLLDALRERNRTVRTVDLSRNTIAEESLDSLERLLVQGRVVELKLNGNSVGDAALVRVGRALQRSLGSALAHLSLEANCITDAGVESFCALIQTMECCDSLRTLNLANNKLTAAACRDLLSSLLVHCSVQELNLRRNNLGDDGATDIAEALRHDRYPCALAAVDISENQIGDDGAAALGEALRSPAPLTTINLHGNSIETDGVKALAQGLVTNASFKSVTLSAADSALDVQHFRTSRLVSVRAMNVTDGVFVSELLKFNLNLKKLHKSTLVHDVSHSGRGGACGAIAFAFRRAPLLPALSGRASRPVARAALLSHDLVKPCLQGHADKVAA